MIRNIKELSPDQKSAVEQLLGRGVSDDEVLSIRAFEAPPVPDHQRRQVADELRQLFAEIQVHQQSIPDEDTDALIAEAMASTRPGFQSHK